MPRMNGQQPEKERLPPVDVDTQAPGADTYGWWHHLQETP